MEKELLSSIETVTYFRHILLGFRLNILSDHKNSSFENFASKHVRHWRLILKEYDYVFTFIPCVYVDNILLFTKENFSHNLKRLQLVLEIIAINNLHVHV